MTNEQEVLQLYLKKFETIRPIFLTGKNYKEYHQLFITYKKLKKNLKKYSQSDLEHKASSFSKSLYKYINL